jgi:hypothetical protein
MFAARDLSRHLTLCGDKIHFDYLRPLYRRGREAIARMNLGETT